MSVEVKYVARATAHGGRDGRVVSDDGSLDLRLSVPREMGGPGGEGQNPERLFAAGYAACFLSALKFVAGKGGVKMPAEAQVTAAVGIGPRSEGGFGLDIDLDIALPGLAADQGQALIDQAHQVCPYSNATRGNVAVRLRLV